MTKTKDELYFTVEGKWPFPADMLRRDYARAATDDDQKLIDLLTQDHCPDGCDIRTRYRIHLIIPAEQARFGPNIERWSSFNWEVVYAEKNGEPVRLEDLARPYLTSCRPSANVRYDTNIDTGAHTREQMVERFAPPSQPDLKLREAVREYIEAVEGAKRGLDRHDVTRDAYNRMRSYMNHIDGVS